MTRPGGATDGYQSVTLLSDLGHGLGHVGVLHSVIAQMAPHARIVDLCHDVDPLDVRAGSLILARSVQYLCPGVVLAAVDPAAGSGRAQVAVEVADGAAVLVGPDNGLLAPAVSVLGGALRAVHLDDSTYHLAEAPSVFAARDILAPVAAHLCNGTPIDLLGSPADPGALTPGLVPLTRIETGDAGEPLLGAEVLTVDRFGNVQLNVDPDEVDPWGSTLTLVTGDGRRTLRRVDSFAGLSPGELGTLVDSDGMVSIVANAVSAAEELGLGRGDDVTLTPLVDDSTPGTRTTVRIGRRSDEGPSLTVPESDRGVR
ncbi:MAG: SAM-dependent chlorinase/fluorinase [Microthrixaceae bacterium]